jgi:hypothetical protein
MAMNGPRPLMIITLDDVDALTLDEANTPWMDAHPACTIDVAYAAPICANSRARRELGLETWRPGNLCATNIPSPLQPGYSIPTTATMAHALPGSKTLRGKYHVASDGNWAHPLNAGYDEFSGAWGNLTRFGSDPWTYWYWKKTISTQASQSQVISTTYNTYDCLFDAAADAEAGVQFINANPNAAHMPNHVPPQESHHYGNPTDGPTQMLAMTECVDWTMSRTVPAILAAGYIVILTGDNGSPFKKKKTLYDVGGLRVPMRIWGNGIIPGPRDALVQVSDLYATAMEIRGATGTPPVDSVSFADVIFGASGSVGTREYIRADDWTANGIPPVSTNWRRKVRNRRWGLLDLFGVRYFYDLLADPLEQNDLLLGTLTSEQQAAYVLLVTKLPGNEL